MAPCGRSSLWYLRQASNFSPASANVRNQWEFMHSARKRALKASIKGRCRWACLAGKTTWKYNSYFR